MIEALKHGEYVELPKDQVGVLMDKLADYGQLFVAAVILYKLLTPYFQQCLILQI